MLNKSNLISLPIKAFLVLTLLFGLYSVVQSDVLAECTAVGQDCSSLRCGTNCGDDSQCNFCYKYGKCATDDEGETYYCETTECVLQCTDGCPCGGGPTPTPEPSECPDAPGEPTNATCTLDTVNHTATLDWDVPLGGTTPTDHQLVIIQDGQGSNCSDWFFCDFIPMPATSYTWDANYTSSSGGDIFSEYHGWMDAVYIDPQCPGDYSSDSVSFTPCIAPPTCNVTAGVDGPLTIGSPATSELTINFSNVANGTPEGITITTDENQILKNPGQFPSPPEGTYFSTLRLGNNPTVGLQRIDVYAYSLEKPTPTCQTTAYINIQEEVIIINDPPWWQVIGGDVITLENILSNIPGGSEERAISTFDLILDSALGGLPGIAFFGAGDDITPPAGDTQPSISSTDWNASSDLKFIFANYTYNYFHNLIPASIVPVHFDAGHTIRQNEFSSCVKQNGYCWYVADGSVSIESQQIDNNKIILFVEGNLNILDKILFNDGVGFFMVIARDNILVSGDVTGDPALEGIYYSQGGSQGERDIQVGFETGSSNNPLYIRGVVATLDDIALERDLEEANSTDPSEAFEFAPDVILNYPRALINRKLRWIGEVNP